jgi:hypothetical protein
MREHKYSSRKISSKTEIAKTKICDIFSDLKKKNITIHKRKHKK